MPGAGLGDRGASAPSLHYHWVAEGGSKFGLFVGDFKIGLYDAKTDVFRRVNVDGTLSAPCGKPWSATAAKQSETAHDAPRSTAKAEKPATPAHPPTPATTSEPAAESESAGTQPLLIYGVGGSVTGLMLLFMFAAARRGI